MKLRKAERKHAKIRLALQGPSGSGKTYSALLLAYGITGSWEKIAVIDSENRSADLYASLGEYKVLPLEQPFTPERYVEAIHTCESENVEVIIIDSISHEWEGQGGILAIHGNMPGNSFTNWNKVTPRHNAFVQSMLQSPSHIIGTIRSKQDYVLSEKNGKQVPEKVGLKGITRDGMDYEFTIVLDIDLNHNAKATKDRTNIFIDQPEFKISSAIGEQILKWCAMGTSLGEIEERINECTSVEGLKKLYFDYPEFQLQAREAFSRRKSEITNVEQKQIENGSLVH